MDNFRFGSITPLPRHIFLCDLTAEFLDGFLSDFVSWCISVKSTHLGFWVVLPSPPPLPLSYILKVKDDFGFKTFFCMLSHLYLCTDSIQFVLRCIMMVNSTCLGVVVCGTAFSVLCFIGPRSFWLTFYGLSSILYFNSSTFNHIHFALHGNDLKKKNK